MVVENFETCWLLMAILHIPNFFSLFSQGLGNTYYFSAFSAFSAIVDTMVIYIIMYMENI